MKTTTVNPPRKAKGSSKKTKKGWRKNVDIGDIDEYLDEQRLEQRLGGAFAERADEELFTVDTVNDEDEKIENKTDVIADEGPKVWRRKRDPKPLKCFQHLEITNGVSDPKSGRNRTKTLEERKNPIVTAKEKALVDQGVVKAKTKIRKQHRELERLKKDSEKLVKSTRRRTKFDFDLWDNNKNEKTNNVKETIDNNEWLETNTKLLNKNKTGNMSRSLPVDFHEKSSKLNAVEIPHAGLSYNPSLKDHQDILWKAAVVEMQKERADRKIEYHTTRMFPDVRNAPTKESIFAEMSEGIPALDKNAAKKDSDDDEIVEEEEEETEPKMFKPKTKKQRNRTKQEKYEENVKKSQSEDKKKSQDVFKLKSMKKDFKLQEKVTEMRGKIKESKLEAKKFSALTLSNTKFEEPEIPLKLSDELTGNLRSLKPEGNLLEDRFKSLQKRNILETRTKKKLTKAKARKRKKVEKRNYKMGFSWENKKK